MGRHHQEGAWVVTENENGRWRDKVGEMHQQKVTQKNQSAEGSAGWTLVQNHKAYSMERRSADPEETRRRCKGKELTKHRQCKDDVQNLEDKSAEKWGIEEIRGSFVQATRVRIDKGFEIVHDDNKSGIRRTPSESSLDQTKELRGQIAEPLEKMKQSGKWPQQVCTTMFFLIRRLSQMRDQLRLWQRGFVGGKSWGHLMPRSGRGEVPRYWEATDGRNGGAQQTVGDEEVQIQSRGRRSRCVGIDSGLDEGLRASQHPCGLDLDDALQLPEKIFRALWVVELQRRLQFEDCATEPLQTITAILSESKLSCLLLRIVLQDALRESQKFTFNWNGRFLWMTSRSSWGWKTEKWLNW